MFIYLERGLNVRPKVRGDIMGRVKVGEHVWMNISRRSICDNCSARLCTYRTKGRMMHCPKFSPALVAFKRCKVCGEVFEVSSNFRALNYDICQRCNGIPDDAIVIESRS